MYVTLNNDVTDMCKEKSYFVIDRAVCSKLYTTHVTVTVETSEKYLFYL